MIPRPLLPSHSDPLTLRQGYPGRPPAALNAVLSAVRGGAATTDEIRRRLGWIRRSRKSVDRLLSKLAAHGFIEACWRAT